MLLKEIPYSKFVRIIILLIIVFCFSILKAEAQIVYAFTNCGISGSTGPTSTNISSTYTVGNTLYNAVTSSSGIQTWTVPTTGQYSIQAKGARGGNGATTGGSGADIKGIFNLVQGHVIKIVVGQNSSSTGGGGGSFVYDNTTSTLLIAAGGGGGGANLTYTQGNTTTSGYNGYTTGFYSNIYGGGGGTNGGGGGAGSASDNSTSGGAGGNGTAGGNTVGSSSNAGAGGAGFSGNGGNSSNGSSVGGKSWANGMLGGGNGGFGGGGNTSSGYGGGGGYSGGGGGAWQNGWTNAYGGGGGSYNSGTNQTNVAGSNAGAGAVTITYLFSAGTIANSQALCGGLPYTPAAFTETVSASGGSGTYTYQWQTSTDNVTFSDITGEVNTTYTAPIINSYSKIYYRRKVTDNSTPTPNVSYTNVLSITVDETPTTATASNIVLCSGTSTTLTGNTPSVGTGVWSYISGGTSTPTITSNSSPTSSISGLASPYTYVLRWTISSSNNICSSYANINLVTGSPAITSSTTASNCGPATLTLSASSNAGIISWYTSSSGGSAVATGTSYTTPLLSTTTTYYVDATGGGCTTLSRTAITATINPIPVVTNINGSNSICVGGNINLTNSTTGGVWSSTSNAIATVNSSSGTSTVTGVSAGTATISYTVTSNGCSNTVNQLINVYALPIVSVSGNLTDIDLVSLTANGGDTYSWSGGSTVNTTSNTFTVSGLYRVTATTNTGCASSTTFNITVQHYGLNKNGRIITDSTVQVGVYGEIGSMSPASVFGKKNVYPLSNRLSSNLSTSQSSFSAAANNTWVSITASEYANLMSMNGATKNSASDLFFSSYTPSYAMFNGSLPNGTATAVANHVGTLIGTSVSVGIPTNAYLFAIRFSFSGTFSNVRVGYIPQYAVGSSLVSSVLFTQVGTSISGTASGDVYFVYKGSAKIPTAAELCIAYPVGIGFGFKSVGNSNSSLTVSPGGPTISTDANNTTTNITTSSSISFLNIPFFIQGIHSSTKPNL